MCETNHVSSEMVQGSYVGICGVYVGVCWCMWDDVLEPNHVSSGMVQDSYVGVCGVYVGVCGRVCVNQIVV